MKFGRQRCFNPIAHSPHNTVWGVLMPAMDVQLFTLFHLPNLWLFQLFFFLLVGKSNTIFVYLFTIECTGFILILCMCRYPNLIEFEQDFNDTWWCHRNTSSLVWFFCVCVCVPSRCPSHFTSLNFLICIVKCHPHTECVCICGDDGFSNYIRMHISYSITDDCSASPSASMLPKKQIFVFCSKTHYWPTMLAFFYIIIIIQYSIYVYENNRNSR